MARRKKKPGWLLRGIALVLLIAAGAAAYLWWEVQHWTPDSSAYPDQGAYVSAEDGPVNFKTLKAIGAEFVYLQASEGSDGLDPKFAGNFAAARAAGINIGAVHRFDPCILADGQTAKFVTVVPRTADMLPPAIALIGTADHCPKSVSDAAVESELMTLINQIENHSGNPVILKVDPEFEAAYGISAKLERNLWVSRTRFAPTYTPRPWLLWSANEYLQSEAGEEPLEWVVVQP